MKSLHADLAVAAKMLVLIGGGEFSFGETRAIDEFLLAHMPADRRTIAFLPTASGSADYATHIGKYFLGLDPTVETVNVPIYRGRDSRRQKSLSQILSAGMIYLGGGVTNNVLATVGESPADLAMRDAAAGGAVVAAIGAAASCFGMHVRDMRSNGALTGLGWLQSTVIDTAFDPSDDEMLRRLMSFPDVRLGLGIPAGAAVAISTSGATEVLGHGSVAVFRKG